MKWRFNTVEDDDRGLFETRGHACEVVAWRLLTYLSEREVLDYLTYELPAAATPADNLSDEETGESPGSGDSQHDGSQSSTEERAWLLPNQLSPTSLRPQSARSASGYAFSERENLAPIISSDQDITYPFDGLNALEIAAVAEAKDFLSQKVVQRIVNGIWRGDIVFWETLNVHSKRKARLYNERYVDHAGISHVPSLCTSPDRGKNSGWRAPSPGAYIAFLTSLPSNHGTSGRIG